MARSAITIDLGAFRHNVRRLQRLLGAAQLWAVVKADAYGHGARDCGLAAVEEGAAALCVATAGEGLELRAGLPSVRIIVLGPVAADELAAARGAGLELVVAEQVPEGVRVHVKLDTGMGRWGLSELAQLPREIVGVMTHLATADSDLAEARAQLERFLAATAELGGLCRHAANSAAVLALPEAHLDAARPGIALYGLSPFGDDPADHGLRPVLGWTSELAAVRLLSPGQSTGYGRCFVATSETWIGIVPVGYADGFRRDLTGTTVLVSGEPVAVVGTVSMDALAVKLDRPARVGETVTLVGPGVPLESHAQVAGTITYELASRIESGAARARRVVVDDDTT